jgi:hypothetical protein
VTRWLAVMFLALMVISAIRPWLDKFGIGKLPGDLRFRFLGREWSIPLASSVLLSLVAFGIARLI